MKPIWIVDDDQSIRFVLEKALAREDLAVRSFTNPRDVLKVPEDGAQADIGLGGDLFGAGGDLAVADKRHHGCDNPGPVILTALNGLPPPRRAGVPASRGGGFRDIYDSYENRSLGERCITGFGRNTGPPMLPNGYYNNNYQIIQTPDAVVI
eukprot:gene15071-19948_t